MKSRLPKTIGVHRSRYDVRDYRADVDGLRAVAVLSVIGFHASDRLVPGGFVGVDVFFVISGFLISSILFKSLASGCFSFTVFYARRIRRIFPALIIVLLATWALGWSTLMADEYQQLGKNITAGAGFVSNILLWSQSGYFQGTAALKPLLHLWSLGIEEQYYLIWPLALYLAWKTHIEPLKLILSIIVASFVLNVATVGFSPESAFYLPHTRFWELMIGSALAYIHLFRRDEFDAELIRMFSISRWQRLLPDIKAWAGLLLILASVMVLNKTRAFPGCWALLPVLGACMLISAGQSAWINRRFLSSRALVLVGLISYPLYLWHWPLLSLCRIINGGELRAATKLVVIGVAFLLAWATHQWVENPIRYGGNAINRVAAPWLASAMLITLGLGLFTVHARGLPGRYPSDLRELMSFDAKESVSRWRDGQCFLALNRDWRAFDSTCTDTQPAGAQLLFLWGDSHAADLYPGIRQLQSSFGFRLAQYTASLCPPILHFDNPRQKFCRGINDWVWRKINNEHPRVVVMAAQYWPQDSNGIADKISQTIAALTKSGVKAVVVVGPSPEWKEPLARSLFVNYYRTGSFHKIPNRMLYNLDATTMALDRQLKAWVSGSGAVYLSTIDLLCDDAGCLTKVRANGASGLTTFDQHHLTTIGSEYVAKLLLSPLLERR